MGVKSWASVFLALCIIFCVLYIIPYNRKVTLDTFTIWLARLGDKDIPSLTGGYNFSAPFESFESLEEASKAVLYLITYPLRLAYFGVERVVFTIKWFAGAGSGGLGFGGGNI